MTEIRVTEKKESPLLSRTEVTAEMLYSRAPPEKEELKPKLATALSAKENLVVIRKIHTRYGDKKAVISFYIYNNEKDMEEIEPKQKAKKKEKEPSAEREEKTKQPEKEEKKEEAKESKEKAGEEGK